MSESRHFVVAEKLHNRLGALKGFQPRRTSFSMTYGTAEKPCPSQASDAQSFSAATFRRAA
jgi:hypothetical protein